MLPGSQHDDAVVEVDTDGRFRGERADRTQPTSGIDRDEWVVLEGRVLPGDRVEGTLRAKSAEHGETGRENDPCDTGVLEWSASESVISPTGAPTQLPGRVVSTSGGRALSPDGAGNLWALVEREAGDASELRAVRITADGRVDRDVVLAPSAELSVATGGNVYGGFAAGPDSLYVAFDDRDGLVARFEASTGRLTATAPFSVIDLHPAPDGVWTHVLGPGGDVTRLDPVTLAVATRHDVDAGVVLAVSDRALWTSVGDDGSLERVDPATGAVTGSAALQEFVSEIEAAGPNVWTVDEGGLARIDAGTLHVTRVSTPRLPSLVGSDRDGAWIGMDDATARRVERDQLGATVDVDPDAVYNLVVDRATLWAATFDGKLYRYPLPQG
jgi:hypothetical protein